MKESEIRARDEVVQQTMATGAPPQADESGDVKKEGREPREPVKLLTEQPEDRTLAQRLKHSLLYGARQTIFCFGTDAVEPFINKWAQNKVGDIKQGAVTNKHTVLGEVSGDLAAYGAYVAIKTFMAAPVNMLIRGVRNLPVFDTWGKKSVERWAEEHQVAEDDPRYKKRVEDYKTFQAENAVDSAIIATSATGLNLLAQRHWLGNRQSYATMLKGKLLGAGLTLVAMFTSSVIFPKQTRRIEDGIEEKLINPGMSALKRTLGIREEPQATITKTPEGQSPAADIPLSAEKRVGLLNMVGEHALKIDYRDPAKRAHLLGKQKAVYEAFIKALDPEGPVVAAMIHEHYETLNREHRLLAREPDQSQRDYAASEASVHASIAHKRRDMQHFIALLGDPKFLKEVDDVVASGTLPERKNSAITSEQRNYMSESLLKKSKAGSDPSVAIMDSAEYQQLDYKALAHAMEPEGIAARRLASELKKLLPDYDPKDIDGIAKDYMGYYQKEAQNVAAEFDATSPTVRLAVERSQKIRSKYQPGEETPHAVAV